jgi:hypothetical protein
MINFIKLLFLKIKMKCTSFISVNIKKEDYLIFVLKEMVSMEQLDRMNTQLKAIGVNAIVIDGVSLDKIIQINKQQIIYKELK